MVAHDLLLLLLDDEVGKVTAWVTEPDKALAGAVLVDLAERELIDVAREGSALRKGRLVVRGGGRPDEGVLREALEVVRAKEGRKPDAVLGPLAKGLRGRLAGDLVAAGLLRREERRVFGLFRTYRLPAVDDAYETELRSRLADVLAGRREPDGRTGPLIGLLHAVGAVTKVLVVEDKKVARRRAKEIAKGEWAAAAVGRAIQAVQAAVVAALIASTAATSGDGG